MISHWAFFKGELAGFYSFGEELVQQIVKHGLSPVMGDQY